MVLKSAILAAAVAAFAFTASTDAFAAKKGKKGYKNSVQHEKTHRVAHKGLPMRVILRDLRHRGYRKLRVRDGRLPGYKIKACKNGKRFLLGVNRWGGIKWRERRGHCSHFKNFKNYGNQIILRFSL